MQCPPNDYIYDRFAQIHQRELMHEAEQERLAAEVSGPRRHRMRAGFSRLSAFLAHFAAHPMQKEQSIRVVTGDL